MRLRCQILIACGDSDVLWLVASRIDADLIFNLSLSMNWYNMSFD